MGFALTSAAALRLNRIVVDELLAAGVPALALQPSTTLVARGGQLVRWDTDALERALKHWLVPVIHGDVAFDEVQGSAIISTEQLLAHLAALPALQPNRIVLVGESGVIPPIRAPTRTPNGLRGLTTTTLPMCWQEPATRTASM